MTNSKSQLLPLILYGNKAVCLLMGRRRGKYPRRMGYNESNLITPPITTPFSRHGCTCSNVNIDLINCHWICNKCDELSGVVKRVDLDALSTTETRLTAYVSDHPILGDDTPAGYTFCIMQLVYETIFRQCLQHSNSKLSERN